MGVLTFTTALLTGACLTATQITVHVTTNAKCDDSPGDKFMELAVAAGRPDRVSEQAPAGTTAKCIPLQDDLGTGFGPNDLGTLVLIPQEDKEMGLEVVTVASIRPLGGNSVELNDCLAWVATGMPADGFRDANDSSVEHALLPVMPCLLARRQLGFVPHLKLELPIQLDTRCTGVFCQTGSTCVDHSCVSAMASCAEDDPTCNLGTGGGGGNGMSTTTGVSSTGGLGGLSVSSSGGSVSSSSVSSTASSASSSSVSSSSASSTASSSSSTTTTTGVSTTVSSSSGGGFGGFGGFGGTGGVGPGAGGGASNSSGGGSAPTSGTGCSCAGCMSPNVCTSTCTCCNPTVCSAGCASGMGYCSASVGCICIASSSGSTMSCPSCVPACTFPDACNLSTCQCE